MTPLEYLQSGRRLCKCEGIKLRIVKHVYYPRKHYSTDPVKHLISTALYGAKLGKPFNIYSARCIFCGKIYLSGRNQRLLKQQIIESGVLYYEEKKVRTQRELSMEEKAKNRDVQKSK